jgi:hypothetical protein
MPGIASGLRSATAGFTPRLSACESHEDSTGLRQ